MTSKVQNIQYQLDEWKKEYGIEKYTVAFSGYRNMNESNPTRYILGKCYYTARDRCDIYLGNSFADRKLGWRETSVLFHEFCHALAYLEDGKGDAHNDYWRELRRSKPKYLLGDWLAKMTYLFL